MHEFGGPTRAKKTRRHRPGTDARVQRTHTREEDPEPGYSLLGVHRNTPRPLLAPCGGHSSGSGEKQPGSGPLAGHRSISYGASKGFSNRECNRSSPSSKPPLPTARPWTAVHLIPPGNPPTPRKGPLGGPGGAVTSPLPCFYPPPVVSLEPCGPRGRWAGGGRGRPSAGLFFRGRGSPAELAFTSARAVGRRLFSASSGSTMFGRRSVSWFTEAPPQATVGRGSVPDRPGQLGDRPRLR